MYCTRYNRVQRIQRLRWQLGAILPEDIRDRLHPSEKEFVKNYSENLGSYMTKIDLDLTVVMQQSAISMFCFKSVLRTVSACCYLWKSFFSFIREILQTWRRIVFTISSLLCDHFITHTCILLLVCSLCSEFYHQLWLHLMCLWTHLLS